MKSTNFPCVKGAMGDWTYYTTVMGFADVVKYVKFAEEVCPNTDLDLMIQRTVGARSKQIAQYLRSNAQRFFGSLIVAAYDGKPRFLPISFGDAPLLTQLEGKVGILQFDGSEQYYAVDGQHRLAAMNEVIAEDPVRYGGDEVSVIVICHSKNSEGIARARRLFTTVNRYAKKTSPVTDIVMDEDDGIAVITRRLIREHPVFKRCIKVLSKARNGQALLATGEAMQAVDKGYLMAIGTFYKCNVALLPGPLKAAFSQPQQSPFYEALELGFEQISQRWNSLIDVIEPWRGFLNPQDTVEKYRTSQGGHVLVRPVGIASFCRAIPELLDCNAPLNNISNAVQLYANLSQAPWSGVLWNSTSNRMIAGKEAENLARRLWRYLLGLGEDKTKLEIEWRSRIDPQNQKPDLKLPAV